MLISASKLDHDDVIFFGSKLSVVGKELNAIMTSDRPKSEVMM